jgi:hypothetical protein
MLITINFNWTREELENNGFIYRAQDDNDALSYDEYIFPFNRTIDEKFYSLFVNIKSFRVKLYKCGDPNVKGNKRNIFVYEHLDEYTPIAKIWIPDELINL